MARTLRIQIASFGLAVAVILGALGVVVTFAPGAEVWWFGVAASCAALGLLYPGRRTRGVAAVLVIVLGFGSFAGMTRRASPSDRPDPNWRAESFEGFESLRSAPQVSVLAVREESASVLVRNDGKATLIYYAAGPDHPQLYQECEERGAWRASKWDWCGTGKESFELAPGASVEMEVRFWDRAKRERMLTHFMEKPEEVAETRVLRGGLVVLAAE